jgi:hypothetical protein
LHDAPILRQHANPEPDGIFGKDNYNAARTHLSLDKDTPVARAVQ